MKEWDIVKLLARDPNHRQRYQVLIPNCYVTHDNECDLFTIRNSGFTDEFEVKISRSDFLADRKKLVQYRELERGEYSMFFGKKTEPPWIKNKMDALSEGLMPVNYFWYVVPEGMVEQSEVPKFAGLIEVKSEVKYKYHSRLKVVKRPSRLHSRKMSIEEQFRQCKKLGYRFWEKVA